MRERECVCVRERERERERESERARERERKSENDVEIMFVTNAACLESFAIVELRVDLIVSCFVLFARNNHSV